MDNNISSISFLTKSIYQVRAETTLEIARVQRGIDLDEYWKGYKIAHK